MKYKKIESNYNKTAKNYCLADYWNIDGGQAWSFLAILCALSAEKSNIDKTSWVRHCLFYMLDYLFNC